MFLCLCNFALSVPSPCNTYLSSLTCSEFLRKLQRVSPRSIPENSSPTRLDHPLTHVHLQPLIKGLVQGADSAAREAMVWNSRCTMDSGCEFGERGFLRWRLSFPIYKMGTTVPILLDGSEQYQRKTLECGAQAGPQGARHR